jgi:sulfonate transport system permease protein
MKTTVIRIALLFLLGLLWEYLSVREANPKLFPDFSYLIRYSLPSLSTFGNDQQLGYWSALKVIGFNTGISVVRIMLGTFTGIIGGSLYVGLITLAKSSLKGNLIIFKILRSVPLLALIPLFYYWFGGRESGIILYIAFAVAVIFSTGLYHAVLNVSESYLQQARILSLSRWMLIKHVIVYAILPELYSTVVYIVGLTWAIALAAEYLAGTNGLGYLIFMSYYYSNMGHLIILSAVYCSLGISTYFLLKSYFERLLKWN